MKTQGKKRVFGHGRALLVSAAVFLFIALVLGSGVLHEAYGQWWDPTDLMTPAQSPIRAQHFLELRNAIDNKRSLCGLTPITWTDPSLIRGQTPIRAIHMKELRNAIDDIYNEAPARTKSFSFTGDTNNLTGIPISLSHIKELRLAWEEATCCGDGVCNGPETTTSCSGDCLCNYGQWTNVGGCGGACDAFEVRQIKVDSSGTPGCDDLYQCSVDFITCCDYGEWTNVGCGEMDCKISDMAQIQQAALGCPDNFQCFPNHPNCCSYATTDSVIGCGEPFGCNSNEVLWGKKASRDDCPLDPKAVCHPDVDHGMDCCGYQDYANAEEDCGVGGGCKKDEMYQVSQAKVYDPVYCPDKPRCIFLEDCCDYGGYIQDACGGICDANEMREVNSPPNKLISENCPVLERCVLNEALCCGTYGPYEDQGCGVLGSGCDPDEMYQIARPLDPASECEDHTRCVLDPEACCGGYDGWENQGCGAPNCPEPEQVYQVDAPKNPSSGCETVTRCVTDLMQCCGGYTGWQDVACGPNSDCAVKYMLQENRPTLPGSECEVFKQCVLKKDYCCGGAYVETTYPCGEMSCAANAYWWSSAPPEGSVCPTYEKCIVDEIKCCGGYGAYENVGCGPLGSCATNQMYQVSKPNLVTSGCPNKVKCVADVLNCCTWGVPTDVGCGEGNCAANQMQRVEVGSTGCEDKYSCVLDENCAECTPGALEVCTTPEGCPGKVTCGDDRLYGACVQDDPVCTIGEEQKCMNAQGLWSYQFCTSCQGWGPCSCDYGDVRPCTTPGGCPGQRTCANNIWEACQRITVCTPGTTVACLTPELLPGVRTCNDCGDAYLNECLCENGTTTPCTGGIRTCILGVWGDCEDVP